jgi:sulfite reductase (NADPH) hemoprotein beta-component
MYLHALMYKYDDYDHAIVQARVAQFRGQTERYLAGKLSDDEFRPLRLQNGLYIQRHGPMLRLAVPYGLLSAHATAPLRRRRPPLRPRLRPLHHAPQPATELGQAARGAGDPSRSGAKTNCTRSRPRATASATSPPTISPASPPTKSPIRAPGPRSCASGPPSTRSSPTCRASSRLRSPGATEDRAAIQVHDLGLQVVKNDAGEIGFKVYAGGGLGRTPLLGQVIREFLPWQHLLTYTEALVRVFNRHGRRDNAYKARIKILVKALGREEFTAGRGGMGAPQKRPATLTAAEVDRVSAQFAAPAYETLAENDLCHLAHLREDKAFSRWVERNVQAHKVAGYAAVTLSLKKPGAAPGDASSEQMEAAADLAERYSFGEIRVSHEQNLILADVPQRELYTVWHRAKAAGLAAPTAGLIQDLIACPGGDFCALANARSLPIAAAIQERFEDIDHQHDIGDLELNISGCMNSCGHHHLGAIGILGVDKNGEEWYQITLGGRQGNEARIGDVIGRAFAAAEVPDAIERLISVYLAHRHADERFIDTFDRIGIEAFQSAAYPTPPSIKESRKWLTSKSSRSVDCRTMPGKSSTWSTAKRPSTSACRSARCWCRSRFGRRRNPA